MIPDPKTETTEGAGTCSGQPINAGGLPSDGVIYPGDPAHCEACALSRPQAPTDQRIAELRERLYLRAAERDDNRGCEHTTSFGEWCSACRAQEVQDKRDAADALTVLQQRVDELSWSLKAAEKRATEAAQRVSEITERLELVQRSYHTETLAHSETSRFFAEEQARRESAEQRLEAAVREIEKLRPTGRD